MRVLTKHIRGLHTTAPARQATAGALAAARAAVEEAQASLARAHAALVAAEAPTPEAAPAPGPAPPLAPESSSTVDTEPADDEQSRYAALYASVFAPEGMRPEEENDRR